MNRIRVLSAALGIAALLAFVGNPLAARAADQAHTLSVRLDWLPSGYHAPFWLAVDKGWFKDAGLDVTIADGNPRPYIADWMPATPDNIAKAKDDDSIPAGYTKVDKAG